jgi:glycosyltransferase involved in cell wall biosynthesis
MSTFLDRETAEKTLNGEAKPTSGAPQIAIEENGDAAARRKLPHGLVELPPSRGPSRKLAVFCFESANSLLGQQLRLLVTSLAERGSAVHLFTRDSFNFHLPNVKAHPLGELPDGELLGQVEEFTCRACNAFQEEFPPACGPVTLFGVEWSSAQALSLLRGTRNLDTVLSLHSLERQRSDMSNELSQRINEIELNALRESRYLLFHDAGTAEVARYWVPDCAPRSVLAAGVFPTHHFEPLDDPGVVKGRYQVGPVDPLILCVGDMNQQHGPDILMRSVGAILKNHPQARFVFVGDGELLWPLRVHARYLFLERAVRLLGHMNGPAVYDLVRAADVVVVPSREQTEWWPIQAAWAARKPVVLTQPFTEPLQIQHEGDAIAVFPHESSLVWGIERVLYDAELQRSLGEAGRRKLEERFGWVLVAQQLEGLMTPATAAEAQ